MDNHEFSKKLLDRLMISNNFLLTSHRNADPDGIGSEIGLDYLLRNFGKNSIIVNQEPISSKLRFLDPEKRVQSYSESDTVSLADRTVVFLDNSDLDRGGPLSNFVLEDNSNWIVIDHHERAKPDYRVFFQNPEIGSTSEIIYELYETAKLDMPINIASAIYAGIVKDTGHFRYAKTRPRTHEIAARLLMTGIKPAFMAEKLLDNMPVERLLLKRILYNKLKLNHERNIAWFQVSKSDIDHFNLTFDDLDGLVNELVEPDGVKIGIIFTEREPGITRVSVRSRGNVDLIPAVRQFGGNGHKNACGATIRLDMQGAIREFIPVVTRCVEADT